MLRFNKGRVLAPSAKNFLMCIDNGEGDGGKDGALIGKRAACMIDEPH